MIRSENGTVGHTPIGAQPSNPPKITVGLTKFDCRFHWRFTSPVGSGLNK